MSVEYVGVYYPFIGYLKEKQTVSLEEFKSKFTDGTTGKNKEQREKRFEKFLESLSEDHIVTVEYDMVTFNEEQWNIVLNYNKE